MERYLFENCSKNVLDNYKILILTKLPSYVPLNEFME